MLQQLLNRVIQGSALDVNQLAREIGVSRNQVVLMMEELERMGKVKRIDICESNGCNTCSVSPNSCSLVKKQPLSWVYNNN